MGVLSNSLKAPMIHESGGLHNGAIPGRMTWTASPPFPSPRRATAVEADGMARMHSLIPEEPL
jgi:hypothetical protein